jgi:hypothetical protein
MVIHFAAGSILVCRVGAQVVRARCDWPGAASQDDDAARLDCPAAEHRDVIGKPGIKLLAVAELGSNTWERSEKLKR